MKVSRRSGLEGSRLLESSRGYSSMWRKIGARLPAQIRCLVIFYTIFISSVLLRQFRRDRIGVVTSDDGWNKCRTQSYVRSMLYQGETCLIVASTLLCQDWPCFSSIESVLPAFSKYYFYGGLPNAAGCLLTYDFPIGAFLNSIVSW